MSNKTYGLQRPRREYRDSVRVAGGAPIFRGYRTDLEIAAQPAKERLPRSNSYAKQRQRKDRAPGKCITIYSKSNGKTRLP